MLVRMLGWSQLSKIHQKILKSIQETIQNVRLQLPNNSSKSIKRSIPQPQNHPNRKKKHPKLPKKSIPNSPTPPFSASAPVASAPTPAAPPLPPSPRPVPGPRKPPNAPGRPGDVGTVVQNFVDNPMYQWICHGYHTFENAYHPIIDVVLHITNGWLLSPQLRGLLVALHADQSCKYVRSRVKIGRAHV